MPDWAMIAIGVGITLLFFVPALLLRLAKKDETRRHIAFFLDEPLAPSGAQLQGPVQVEGVCSGKAELFAPLCGE